MELSTSYNYSSISLSSQSFALQGQATPAQPPKLMPNRPGRDVVHLSEKALESSQKYGRRLEHKLEKALDKFADRFGRLADQEEDHASERAREVSEGLGRGVDHTTAKTLEFIGDLMSRLTGREVGQLLAAPKGPEQDPAVVHKGVTDTSRTTLSAESLSLSISGSIETRDGAQLSFNLALQYDHVLLQGESTQLQSDGNSVSLNYAGTAAELTSTSFSFSLSAEGSFETAQGIGKFVVGPDDLDRQRHLHPESANETVAG